MLKVSIIKKQPFKIIISESQFQRLAENILNEQYIQSIRKTHLIRVKSSN